MSRRPTTAELDEDWDGYSASELPGPVTGVTGAAPPESGTHEVGSAGWLPRMYEDIQDEPGTQANESIIAFAKLSNPKSLPRIVRHPRPGEPIERRGAALLGFIDGRTPLGIIFASAGVDEGEAVVILAQLVDLGIIVIR